MDVQRLAKVLALAASDNDAEALHALRTAGRLLEGAGLDFVALASRVAEGGPVISSTRLEDLEDTIFDLRNEIRHLRSENETLRQTGPAPANGLASAAQDVAQIIRLQAERDELRQALGAETRRADAAQAAEQARLGDLAQAIDAAERLAAQLEALKGRTDRLEAENRRLGLVATALKGELDERLADRNHPLPPVAASQIVSPVAAPVVRAEPAPRRPAAPPPPPARRPKAAPPVNQYALF